MLCSSSMTRILALGKVLLFFLTHFNEVPMPGVREDLAGVAVDAEHANRFAIAQDVQGVISIELVSVILDCCPRQVLIQVTLGGFDSLLRGDRHFGGNLRGCRVTRLAGITAHHTPHTHSSPSPPPP